MNQRINELLQNKGGNYIFPFLWMHGETEEVLRKYMGVIHDCGIGAVCVESRPHPDFCGNKWWEDMDIILDEARNRGMKLWILDDSHFPTGFANGAMAEQPDERCRQSVCCRSMTVSGGNTLSLCGDALEKPDPFQPTMIEQFMLGEQRAFDDDRLLAVTARRLDAEAWVDLTDRICGDTLTWEVPEGSWRVSLIHLSRNRGYHRSYINMMDRSSCRVLIDAVYEPHFRRYHEDFGKTIAGFFSDEPELGNGHVYAYHDAFGTDNDYPWSEELEKRLRSAWGSDMGRALSLLWDTDADETETARARYTYMDAVTRLVQEDFSRQLGTWCRNHGVRYIGHLIEDDNHHARTGSSLGHYFRGLSGQDMAGIDDIGGQVLPQGEDIDYDNGEFAHRSGSFYHYLLGKLASSAAAIEPGKSGDSMCEIFGNYGWDEGVRLEKYLIDHFMVRGVNHFVPHAFSPKEFPDPDCPPHFYAHGNNPQYRHFGALMRYTNRVCHLISGGRHTVSAAVLYHAESEWTGGSMTADQIGHVLYDSQLDYDVIPQDVFAEPEAFSMEIGRDCLRVNGQEYPAVIIPAMPWLTAATARVLCELHDRNIPVLFAGERPKGIIDDSDPQLAAMLSKTGRTAEPEELPALLEPYREVNLMPADPRIRALHYVQADGTVIWMVVNEGAQPYSGTITFTDQLHTDGIIGEYDAWSNVLCSAEMTDGSLALYLEPSKSRIFTLVPFSGTSERIDPGTPLAAGQPIPFTGEWQRSLCRSIDYPVFGEPKTIRLPDRLESEEPEFSGFVCYENTFSAERGSTLVLEISDACEGVEVFLNGNSLGIQVVPFFRYVLRDSLISGENHIRIEVATTLSREMAKYPDSFGQIRKSSARGGITGDVQLSLIS